MCAKKALVHFRADSSEWLKWRVRCGGTVGDDGWGPETQAGTRSSMLRNFEFFFCGWEGATGSTEQGSDMSALGLRRFPWQCVETGEGSHRGRHTWPHIPWGCPDKTAGTGQAGGRFGRLDAGWWGSGNSGPCPWRAPLRKGRDMSPKLQNKDQGSCLLVMQVPLLGRFRGWWRPVPHVSKVERKIWFKPWWRSFDSSISRY